MTAGGVAITDPIVGDLAAASSDLVFGDGVRFTFNGVEAEKHTAALLLECQPVLIEAAEECAALGGVYLLPIVEDDQLIVETVSADCVRPYWQRRRLRTAITLQQLAQKDVTDHKSVWRVVTCYKHDGTIAYRLNRGWMIASAHTCRWWSIRKRWMWWPNPTSPEEHVVALWSTFDDAVGLCAEHVPVADGGGAHVGPCRH